MDVQEELQLFKRYTEIFKGSSTALVGIASVHLAQQLERYISPSLDLGWVIRCILDINSKNLFSNCRGLAEEMSILLSNSVHPEYKYAEFIIKLCNLFICVTEGKTLTTEEAEQYTLNSQSEFYFGEQLSELNNKLLQLACAELSEVR